MLLSPHAALMASSARVQQIVSLVAELTDEERLELVGQLESGGDRKRARVAEAIQRVMVDHRSILAALAK